MNNKQINKGQGLGKSIFNISQQVITTLVNIVDTRLKLAIVELEKEKNNLIQIFILIGLTILFTAFGLMSLILLLIWSLNIKYRLIAITIITFVLFILAVFFGICVLIKSRNSRLLRHTRQELDNDRKLLEEYD
ncbi:phage holin family protein [Pantoea sp. Aalb]|uniref:phage holin family protein n=1 Tax=Pantoea sp. Aalb TaxID=2576762 RepID=UPI00132A0140|nr:phage holin family protein [Pantoea sp. Aalb]MXP67696.1 hypothetical protein [Pantoea sp. Aalb]